MFMHFRLLNFGFQQMRNLKKVLKTYSVSGFVWGSACGVVRLDRDYCVVNSYVDYRAAGYRCGSIASTGANGSGLNFVFCLFQSQLSTSLII